jgi:tetratricopeptide (TPR) repeat protein
MTEGVVGAAMRAARDDILNNDKTGSFEGLRATDPTWGWEPKGRLTTINALIDLLNIRRFITTNFDGLIEERLGPRLIQEGRVPRPLGSGRERHFEAASPDAHCPSIDRLLANAADLIAFAMGGEGAYGVVHLHGRLHAASDPSPIVLTESQYQQQYESDRSGTRDRRDAYELLLQANPLLFIGASLDDEDSLRPLRRYVADYDVASFRRPWFALLSGAGLSDVERVHKFNQIYFRYGLSAIFTASNNDKLGVAHVDLIQHIADGWANYRTARALLPVVRRPLFSSHPPITPGGNRYFMAHHASEYPIDLSAKAGRASKAVEQKLGLKGGAIIVLGRQGSGKGSFGYAAAQADFGFRGEAIRFFGTTVFANKFLTLIDGAANHIHAVLASPVSADRVESRLARLFRAIEDAPMNVVLAFGGIDKILRAVPYGIVEGQHLPGLATPMALAARDAEPLTRKRGSSGMLRWGRAANPEIEEFFERLAAFDEAQRKKNENYKKIIILTSSMIPVLGSREVQQLSDRICEDLGPIDFIAWDQPPWNSQAPDEWSEICRKLSNNKYAIDTLFRICGNLGKNENARKAIKAWLKSLNFAIERAGFNDAPAIAIQSIVDLLTKSGAKGGDATAVQIGILQDAVVILPALMTVLETLSRFITPIEPSVFAIVIRAMFLAKAERLTLGEERDWATILALLHEKTNLILKFGRIGDYEEPRYTTHSLVRRAVSTRRAGHLDRPSEVQQFDLNDFASEPPEIQPLIGDTAQQTLHIVDAIVVDAWKCNESPNQRAVRSRIRAAYAVLRGSWSATGMGRLLFANPSFSITEPGSLYQIYRRRLARLLDLVYAHAPPPESATGCETADAALYPDELGWLLNELGLTCSAQGLLTEAITYFRLGQRLNSQTEGRTAGYRCIVSNINMASVLIELAQLRQARDLLHQAITLTGDLDAHASELRARIHGYLGLVAHLAGDTRRAFNLYNDAIDNLHQLEAWRGMSVFSRHKCDLLRGQNRFEDAERSLQEAIEAAEAGFHTDLLHYCRISEANLRRVWKKPNGPSPSMLTPTLEFATTIGSAKIESDVFRVRGLIELDNSDLDAATRSTMRCLLISRANGLNLRVMSSMELLGRLLAERGYIEQAKSTYRTVIYMGQTYEYERPVEFVEAELAKLER